MFRWIVFFLSSSDAFQLFRGPSRASKTQMRMMCSCECAWEEVDTMKQQIMKKYFEVNVDEAQTCEIFLVEGVPAASLLYKKKNAAGGPIIDSFHLNKAMILLFDAGPHMRHKLFQRHRRVDLQHATNRNDFLFF